MPQPEKNALFITDSVNIKCRKCNHCRNIVNTHSSYFIHHTNINIMDITDSTYDPVQVAEKVLVQQDILCSQRGICLRSNDDGSVCGGQLSHSSSVVNNPFLLVFELDKDENRPIQPGLSSKLHLRVKKDKYDLAVIIYHHNFHFWCEVFVSDEKYACRNNPRETWCGNGTQGKPCRSGLRTGWVTSREYRLKGPYVVISFLLFLCCILCGVIVISVLKSRFSIIFASGFRKRKNKEQIWPRAVPLKIIILRAVKQS